MTSHRLAILLLAGGLLCGQAVLAAEPAIPAPCDPAVRPCLATEGWLITERVWTPGGADPRDLVGGRVQAEVRWHRWRWAARGDATGIPGTYQAGDWRTVRSVEGHVASAFDVLRLPGGVTFGPAAGFGAAVTLEEGLLGAKPTLPKRVTAGLGFRASWPGGFLWAVAGQHQALRGVAGVAVWQVRLSDHVANVGRFAVGANNWTSTIGVAVRLK